MSLSPISTASLPADVRNAGTQAIKDYKAALGFEQMLVQQLVQSMAGDGSDDSGDNPLTQGPYASTLQTTLSEALTSNGGLGLAQQLYKGMQTQ